MLIWEFLLTELKEKNVCPRHIHTSLHFLPAPTLSRRSRRALPLPPYFSHYFNGIFTTTLPALSFFSHIVNNNDFHPSCLHSRPFISFIPPLFHFLLTSSSSSSSTLPSFFCATIILLNNWQLRIFFPSSTSLHFLFSPCEIPALLFSLIK